MANGIDDRKALIRLHSQYGLPANGRVERVGYSRFKHGDAAIGRGYARALAALVTPELSAERVMVTTSGFDRVPPAAHSLLAPFAAEVRRRRPDIAVETVKVDRRGVSSDDYARMTTTQRAAEIGADRLSAPAGVAGAVVLALDDIRVTGTHERAVDRCLSEAGAASVCHLYVVDASKFSDCPQVEAVLNSVAAADACALLSVTRSMHFVPNARLCRQVVRLPAEQLTTFVQGAGERLLAWLDWAIETDGLAGLPSYACGVSAFRAEVSAQRGIGVATG
ncbi:phosphoribosyltransferase family protein [Rudaeicoccus suwonensis]|uniref:Phosphoribosyl transferase-like protein n=1 Tax=Rudaeicoccus suwonensis TaxID=657409 RepID=A0A561E492_9MICO|nr:phosphoribosyltransferase family protein [Rudaeicoccus suwonensis]TWE10436.1 phosphoribosyl transferase-like protein [Rudaeicoccus suwonensis]